MLAMANGSAEMLITHDANVNTYGGHDGYDLQRVSLKYDYNTLKLLSNRDAKVNAQGRFHHTASQVASALSLATIVILLIRHVASERNEARHTVMLLRPKYKLIWP
jgi:hypothetical protein